MVVVVVWLGWRGCSGCSGCGGVVVWLKFFIVIRLVSRIIAESVVSVFRVTTLARNNFDKISPPFCLDILKLKSFVLGH